MKNKEQPLVSVVTSFLNEKNYLEKAIESVIAQDYTHWELLLVDDGSTDESTAIAKAWALRCAGKIHYLEHQNHENKGPSSSRNKGIEHAKGKYVAFLDADDIWLPQKLSEQVKIFNDHPGIAMVVEASLYWSSWANATLDDVHMHIGAPAQKIYEPPTLTNFLYPLSTGPAPCPSAIMITKEALLKWGGFDESFTQGYILYEDQAFFHKVYLHEKVYVSSACNNLYRQRPESIVKTATNSGDYDKARIYFLNWLKQYIETHGLNNKRLKRKLNYSFLEYKSPGLYAVTAVLKNIYKKSRKLMK